MQPVADSIHELFVGVEGLDSQPDLHLREEMVIAWRQVRTVRKVVENLPFAWLQHLCEPRCGTERCRAGERRL